MELTASNFQLIREFTYTFNTEENVKLAVQSLKVSEYSYIKIKSIHSTYQYNSQSYNYPIYVCIALELSSSDCFPNMYSVLAVEGLCEVIFVLVAIRMLSNTMCCTYNYIYA